MKKGRIGAAAMLAVVPLAATVIASCSSKGSRENVEFENYEYSYIAEETPKDTVEWTEGRQYWDCHGCGVMPLRIGDRDIKSLRDTLESIARVTFEKGKAKPLLPEGYKEELIESNSREAGSEIVNNLTIDLVTPQVMVWQNYRYAYPAGAAHGLYSNTYINYSLKDGVVITRDKLFKPGSEAALAQMIRTQLAERDDLIVPLEEVKVPDNFRLTTDGVTFVFGLYAIAPYSSGEISVPLNSYSLREVLTDEARTSYFSME